MKLVFGGKSIAADDACFLLIHVIQVNLTIAVLSSRGKTKLESSVTKSVSILFPTLCRLTNTENMLGDAEFQILNWKETCALHERYSAFKQ